MSEHQVWAEKYRPQVMDELIGAEDIKRPILEYLIATKHMAAKAQVYTGPRALLLIGPPGTGKTSSVHAIARTLSMDLQEVNASDTRNKDKLDTLLKGATATNSMLKYTVATGGKILFMDELDGISGNDDRGGLETLIAYLKVTRQPVIMAANTDDDRFKKFGDLVKIIRCHPVDDRDLRICLQRVIEAEGITVEEGALDRLISASAHDYRAAINTLQFLAEPTHTLTLEALTLDSSRDQDRTPGEWIVEGLIREHLTDRARSLREVDLDYTDLLREIGFNLEALIDPAQLPVAITTLVGADQALGIMNETKQFSLLPYFYDLLATLPPRDPPKELRDPPWISGIPYQNAALHRLQELIPAPIDELYQLVVPLCRTVFREFPEIEQEILHRCRIDPTSETDQGIMTAWEKAFR